jgi:hypothetical protein
MLKGVLFYKLESLSMSLGPKFREIGQTMFKAGMSNQGSSAHADYCVPSLRCVPTSAGTYPKLIEVRIHSPIICLYA